MTLKQFKALTGIKITDRHTGKMQGMFSLSTACTRNKYCIQRAADPATICSACFAGRMFDNPFYAATLAAMEGNTDILTRSIIPIDAWPVLNIRVFRLESFGDLNNEIQFQNYVNFCKRNPGTTFALWTKNPGIIERAIKDGTKKPRNLMIVYSSPFINKPVNMDRYRKQFPFIDKFFTVYSDEKTAATAGAAINCGARNCLECCRCYSKRTGPAVNELLK